MRIASLEIANFMGIGHAHLSLADKGLVLLQGENLDDPSADSNGSGKSSLADAIFYCLYGETARKGLSADAVVNRKAGKGCEVKILIEEDSGDTFTVTRWRKKLVDGKRAGVSLIQTIAGTDVDLTKGTDKLTQAEIDRVLGCPKEVFTASVYAGQEALPNLPAMTDTELKTLIEQASGVDTLVRAYKLAREKLGLIQNDQDRWRLAHVRAERDVTDTDARLSDLRVRSGGFEAKKRGEIVDLQKTLKGHIETARQKQTDRNGINAKAVTEAIAKLDVKIASFNDLQEEDTRLAVLSAEATSRHTQANATFKRAVDEAQLQKTRIAKIAEVVGTPCAECGKPYETHDLAKATETAKAKLAQLVTRARELKEDVETCDKHAREALQMLQDGREGQADIRTLVDERRRLAEALVARQRAEDAMNTETLAAQAVKLRIDELKVGVNPFEELVVKAETEADQAAKAYRASEELGVDIEQRVMVMKDVVKVFGPAGVRAHILDNVTPFLNDRTASYLGTMSDGLISAVWSTLSINAKGEVAEKFAINVDKTDMADSFAGLSGGEKRKVRLSCALALQDLVASRATKPINLFIADEIDDALDESGLERLMTVMEEKGRERGTVLLISHNALGDWCRQQVTVTMKGGFSTIEPGVLAP